MSQYIFIGTIHPARAIVEHHEFKIKTTFKTADNKSGNFSADVRILMNQLLIFLEGDDVYDPFTMRNLVQGIVESDLAKVSFITGHSYNVEIVRVSNNFLKWDLVYGINNTLIQHYFPIENYDAALERIRKHSVGQLGIYINNALLNLSYALKNIHDASFYCNRALECLRNHHASRLGHNERDWNLFKLVLGVEDDFIKRKVGSLQANTRHGHLEIISELQYNECIKATWEMFYKYLDTLEKA